MESPSRVLTRYLVEFGVSISFYMGAIFYVVGTRPDPMDEPRWIELLPILPLLLGFWAILRHYYRMDEYFRRLQAEAFALGAMIWGLIVMAWSFAENAGAMPLPTIYVAPGLILVWGLCQPIVFWRYR